MSETDTKSRPNLVAAAEIRYSVLVVVLGMRRLPRFARGISCYSFEQGNGLLRDLRTECLRTA